MARLTNRLPDPEFWRGRRVLLTGHTGFKGVWLSAWLEAMGSAATGLSLAPEPGSLGEIVGIEQRLPGSRTDIRDPVAVREVFAAVKPEIVIHMAAQALVRESYADPLGTFSTNVMGTAHILDAVRATPSVRVVVAVTTDKCYENRNWPYPYRETDALGGHDPYSASKAGAELVVSSWRQSFLAEHGVRTASARAGNVIGGGDHSRDRLVPDCIRAFRAGHPVHLRSPNATRPWQHVLDPLAGYLLLAEDLLAFRSDFDPARAWNFGPSTDNVATVGDVVALLAQYWGNGARWAADAGPHPHEAALLAVDSSQARHELNWRPRLDLENAVSWTTEWYRRQADGDDGMSLIRTQLRDYIEETA